MRVPTWSREPLLYTALAVTLVLLALGHALKSPCLDAPWDGTQYDSRCYNDLQVIYHNRGLDQDQVPYVEAWNEYPAVSGMWMYATAVLTDDVRGFFGLNVAGLSVLALLTTTMLYAMLRRAGSDPRRVFLFAAAPALALYAFHNWDLIAVAAAVAGWWAYREGRWALSGVAFAIGASAKIWPGLFLPFLFFELLRATPTWRGPATRLFVGATGTMLLIHVPFLLWNRALYLEGYAWHLDRGPTVESFWNVARVYTDRWSLDGFAWLVSPSVLPGFTKALFLIGLVLLAVAVWARRLRGEEAAFGAVLLFLFSNQVFSVQYLLWVLPFLVLLDRIPVVGALLLFLADVGVYDTVFGYFYGWQAPNAERLFGRMSFFSTFRHVMLLAGIVLVGVWASGRAEAAREALRATGDRLGLVAPPRAPLRDPAPEDVR